MRFRISTRSLVSLLRGCVTSPAASSGLRPPSPVQRETAINLRCLSGVVVGSLLYAVPASAQSPEDFYRNRQLNMLVFSPAGSTYDNYARALARHMGNFMPGKPTFIVQNMVGAGGLKLVDYLNRIAPKDGSVIGTIGRGLAFEPMLGRNEVNFDPYKIGRAHV